MAFLEKQILKNTVFEGKIVSVRSDVAELCDGTQVTREVAEHNGGVCIVPVDQDGSVYCVRQFRYPLMEELLELPAGRLEPGEDPESCARRELSEETGLAPGSMVSLGFMYTSPGWSTETLHLYLATDLTHGIAHLDPGEFLAMERMPMEELLDQIARGGIRDAKTIAGLLKAQQYLKS